MALESRASLLKQRVGVGGVRCNCAAVVNLNLGQRIAARDFDLSVARLSDGVHAPRAASNYTQTILMDSFIWRHLPCM